MRHLLAKRATKLERERGEREDAARPLPEHARRRRAREQHITRGWFFRGCRLGGGERLARHVGELAPSRIHVAFEEDVHVGVERTIPSGDLPTTTLGAREMIPATRELRGEVGVDVRESVRVERGDEVGVVRVETLGAAVVPHVHAELMRGRGRERSGT